EDGPHLEVLGLRNRIVLVVVAASTVERQSEKRLATMFDGVVEPDIPVELVPVPSQIPGRSQDLGVRRSELVAGEHLLNHLVVRAVGIQRLDNPIAPSPEMILALADFIAISRPISVTPDIH